jgi:hypothetical protein
MLALERGVGFLFRCYSDPTFTPAGVIYAGPRTSAYPNEAIPCFEVIFARRAHFILPDGTLDKPKWERIKLHGTDIFGDD